MSQAVYLNMQFHHHNVSATKFKNLEKHRLLYNIKIFLKWFRGKIQPQKYLAQSFRQSTGNAVINNSKMDKWKNKKKKKDTNKNKKWRQNPPIPSVQLLEINMENAAEIKTFSHKGES